MGKGVGHRDGEVAGVRDGRWGGGGTHTLDLCHGYHPLLQGKSLLGQDQELFIKYIHIF